jgi:hypothetical protein
MKTLTVLIASLLLLTSAFADLGTSIYTATTGTGKATSSGCVYVNFVLSGFTGSVGNASFSNLTFSLPVHSAFQSGAGQRLNPIPYSVTSGTLVITEVK